jgi:hypothetical protein
MDGALHNAIMLSTGQALEKLNLESAGKILSGQMTGSKDALDRSMVRKEQMEVQTLTWTRIRGERAGFFQ